mmetsp:Transcript_12047/g.30530  ORF Transcript_12047/g.30530 Transcript_12047/m.30530 type:complete len:424 (+) Transcript_12047:381-1652(+)
MGKTAAAAADDTKQPTCYGIWFHPYLNWKQKIVSKLIDYFLCLKIMAGSAIGTQKVLPKVRGMFPDTPRTVLKQWEDLAQCPLAVSKGKIRFQSNILKDWGIVQPETVVPPVSDKENVSVVVRFPSSLLQDDSLEADATTGCFSVDFDTIDWKTLAPHVPVMIQFHGGGMVIGQADDMLCVEDTIRVVQTACNYTSTTNSKDVITVSVDYALAPEDPFPRAVMEALSVVDFFKDRTALHLSGNSAGANLSLVAGLEGFRRLGSKIVSIHAHCPFLDPSGDGLSYYTNASVYPNISWLRWCWQAYLGLEKSSEDDKDNDVLRRGSNYTTWNKWKAEHPELQRLVNPTLELPQGLDSEEAPSIIVRYNLGDPLHSDGNMVAQALQNYKKSHSFESLGLHCDAMGPYDPKDPQDYWKVWSKALFSS